MVDSTGIKMMGEGEWKTRKLGTSYRRQWRKVHIGIDAETLDIRAIEVTTNANGEAPTLPDLLAQIPEDETILSVGGDGAYDTKGCHAAIAKRDAEAVIPVRRNGRPWKEEGPGAAARNETLRTIKRLAVPSGRSGAAIIAAALSRPKCTASSCSAGASLRAPSTVRLPNSKSELQSSTASQKSAHLILSTSYNNPK